MTIYSWYISIISVLFGITVARLIYCEVRNKHVRGVFREENIKAHNLQNLADAMYERVKALDKLLKNRENIIHCLEQEVNEIEAAHKNTVKSFDEIIAKKDIMIQELQLNLPELMKKDEQIERLKNINFNLEHNIRDYASRSNAHYEENIKLREELAKFSGEESEH